MIKSKGAFVNMISTTGAIVMRGLALYGLGAALALMPGMASPAQAVTVTPASQVIVVDARTLELNGQQVRLSGIDAPDMGQTCRWGDKEIPCGRIARTALMDLVTAAEITCKNYRSTADGTRVATCFAGGFDIGANMVHTGWALAGPDAPPRYAKTENKARAARRGLWRGQFDPPDAWRRAHR